MLFSWFILRTKPIQRMFLFFQDLSYLGVKEYGKNKWIYLYFNPYCTLPILFEEILFMRYLVTSLGHHTLDFGPV